VRNCEGITNPNFATVLQVAEKRWDVVNVCPITLLPDDYNFKSIYLLMAKKFRFTPDQVDNMPVSIVDFFLASTRAESWIMAWERKKMEAFSQSKKKKTR